MNLANDVIETFMNENECVNSYATIEIYCSAIIDANIKPICSISIFKNDMQEKEIVTITNNQYGWKFPALVTGERFL